MGRCWSASGISPSRRTSSCGAPMPHSIGGRPGSGTTGRWKCTASHAERLRERTDQGGNMKKVANFRFTIKSWDEKPYGEGPDLPKLTRAAVTKIFTGDIV